MKSRSTTRAQRAAADQNQLRLGRAIREARLAKGMTLADLAGKIERTAGYLSQVERGITRPSLEVLRGITNAVGVHPSWFLSALDAGQGRASNFVVRKNNRRKLTYAGGIANELLSPNLAGPMELLMTTLEPGSQSGKQARHTGHECGIVISGKLALTIEGEEYLLEQGDSFAFPSSTPHRFSNPSPEEARVVWALSPPIL